jgi:hypothetical protein
MGQLFSPDTVTGATQSFQSKNVLGANGSTLTVTGYTVHDTNGGANYVVTLHTANGTITAAPLDIYATSDSRQYNGTTSSSQTPTAGMGQLFAPDSLTGATQAFQSKNVMGLNGNTVTVTGYTVNDTNGGANYTVTPHTASGTISAAPLDIYATSDSRQYNGTTSSSQTPTAGMGQLFAPDSLTSATQAFQSKNVLGANGSTLTVTGYTIHDTNGGANYAVTPHTANGTITAAPLDIYATSDSREYNGTTSSSQIPTTGMGQLFSPDTVTGATQAFQSKNVLGANASTLSVTGYTVNDTNGGANYAVTPHTASGTISAAPLDIYATSDSRQYNGTTSSSQTPSAGMGQLFAPDSLTSATQAFQSKNVLGANASTLSVTGYTVNDGNSGNNYTATPHTASGTITPATLDIYATSDSRQYNGTSASSQTPTVGMGQLFSPDTVTGVTQAFQSKNVLGPNGSTLTVTGYTVNDTNGGANYAVTPHTATGTITTAPLDIYATSDSRQYNGTTSSSQVPSAGMGQLFAPDSLTGATQAFQSKNVLGANGSTLSVTGYTVNDTNAGGNYTVTPHTATGTITPTPLDIYATSDTRQYDGTITSSEVPTAGTGQLFAPDSLTGSTQAFQSKNVLGLNGSTLSITGYTVHDTNGGANYTVTPHTANGTITPAPLDIYATSDGRQYNGTTASSQTPTTGMGQLFSPDTVTGSTQAFLAKNVLGANASTLSVTGYTVNDTNGGANYIVTPHTATGTITPAPLDIYATSDSRQYNGTTSSSQTPTAGTGQLFAPDSLTGATQAFQSKNVLGANASTLSVTGYTVNDTNGGANYTVTPHTASGTITPAPLDIYATSESRQYNGLTSSSQIPTTGMDQLFGPDTVTGATQAFQSKNVLGPNGSTLSVTGYTVNDTNGGANYSVTPHTANGTITERTLNVTATADPKVYNGTTTAVAHLADDRVSGDGFTETYSNANFADANMGTGKLVTVTGIGISGGAASNYSLASTSTTATADITAAATTTTITNAASLASTPTIESESYVVMWSVGVNSPGGGTPTGTINVTGGSSCSAPVAAGQCSVTSTTAGIKNLVATYVTDTGNFTGSTSAAASHTVNPAVVYDLLAYSTRMLTRRIDRSRREARFRSSGNTHATDRCSTAAPRRPWSTFTVRWRAAP